MPGSATEGKELVKEFCIKNNIQTVLDIGPGEGTYYYALQGVEITRLDAIEVWGPYLDIYDLRSKYNNIMLADVYYFNWSLLTSYDMIILGDVVEHLDEVQGPRVIARAVENAKYVVVSLPIYGYAQGFGNDGNRHEAHLVQYSDASIREILKDYEILESFKGSILGVYIFKDKE